MPSFDQPIVVPWYRQFWPWFIIALPALSVVAGLTLLGFALNTQDSLVRDDYYKEGMMVNQLIERDHAASLVGLTALIELPAGGHGLSVTLNGDLGEWPAELILELDHPTLSAQDQHFTLTRVDQQRYQAPLDKLPHGRFRLYLYPATGGWRLKGEADLSQPVPVQLRAAPKLG